MPSFLTNYSCIVSAKIIVERLMTRFILLNKGPNSFPFCQDVASLLTLTYLTLQHLMLHQEIDKKNIPSLSSNHQVYNNQDNWFIVYHHASVPKHVAKHVVSVQTKEPCNLLYRSRLIYYTWFDKLKSI